MRQGVFKRIYELLLEDEVITLDQVFLPATPASLPSIPPGDLSLTALELTFHLSSIQYLHEATEVKAEGLSGC